MSDRTDRAGNDRRRYPNRRSGIDRRVAQEDVPEKKVERRDSGERRAKRDRRKWVERRGRKPT